MRDAIDQCIYGYQNMVLSPQEKNKGILPSVRSNLADAAILRDQSEAIMQSVFFPNLENYTSYEDIWNHACICELGYFISQIKIVEESMNPTPQSFGLLTGKKM